MKTENTKKSAAPPAKVTKLGSKFAVKLMEKR